MSSRPKIRIVVVLAFVCLATNAHANDFVTRVWKDLSGKFSVEATLEDYEEGTVKLRTKDNRVISVAHGTLSVPDRDFISAITATEANRDQFEKLLPHLMRLAASPSAVNDIALKLHSEDNRTVVAGFYSSLIAATFGGKDDTDKAQRTLNEVIGRLTTIRKQFPNYQSLALASALNNRAVLSLRKHKADVAAGALVQAAELMSPVPFPVYHNATLLLEVSSLPGSRLDLSSGARKKLVDIVSKSKLEGPGSTVPKRFMFTFAHDSFSSLMKSGDVAAKIRSTAKPTQAIEPGLEMLGSGSGFLIAPNLVLTNRHVVEDGKRFSIRNETSVTTRIKADVLKVSSDVDIDLAVIRLSQNVGAKPLPISASDVLTGSDLAVLGYPNPDAFEETLTVSKGVVNKFLVNGLQILHDSATNPGNSGGPCVDLMGNVIGVHWGRAAEDEKRVRNKAVSIKGINSFLGSLTEYQQFPLNTAAKMNFAEVVTDTKDSVFIVEVWGTATRASRSYDTVGDTLFSFRMIPELMCLDCSGSGWFKCPRCFNGQITVTKEYIAGFEPNTKSPLPGRKTVKEPCPNCSAKGGATCKSCGGTGRIGLN